MKTGNIRSTACSYTLAGKFEILIEILVAVYSRNKTLLGINQINKFRILGGILQLSFGDGWQCNLMTLMLSRFQARTMRTGILFRSSRNAALKRTSVPFEEKHTLAHYKFVTP